MYIIPIVPYCIRLLTLIVHPNTSIPNCIYVPSNKKWPSLESAYNKQDFCINIFDFPFDLSDHSLVSIYTCKKWKRGAKVIEKLVCLFCVLKLI
jgi:sialic acid synthase SpsE